MAETVSFTALTRDAFRNILHDRSLFWMALPAGALITGSSYFASKAEEAFAGKEISNLFSLFLSGTDSQFFLFLGLSLLLILCQTPVRGVVVLLLQAKSQRDTDSSSSDKKKFQRHDYWRAIWIAVFYELGFLLLASGLGLLLFIPSLLAWQFNREVVAPVSQFGFILLFGITLYLYFIKELSLLYGLLGNLRLRSSIDLGFRIFRRHSFLTLLYFTYLSTLSLIATLLIAITTHSLCVIFKIDQSSFLQSILSFPFFGLYFIFDQSLRLTYFRKIASSPKSRLPKVPATKSTEPITGMTNV